MTTKDILNQMEKEFDEKFPEMWGSNDGREGYDADIKETVMDFFSSYTRTLLESFGEEIINKALEYSDSGVSPESLVSFQRLKVKEILSNLK